MPVKRSGECMKAEKDEFLIDDGKSIMMTMRRRPRSMAWGQSLFQIGSRKSLPNLSCGNWKGTAVNSRQFDGRRD